MAVAYNPDGWEHGLFSAGQVANILAQPARYLYLVQWNFSGAGLEYFSVTGQVTYDGQVYGSGVDIDRIDNAKAAGLSMPATDARIAQFLAHTWRHQACRIYKLPAAAGAGDTFVAADAVLWLDGVIDDARLSDAQVAIEVSVINRHLTGAMSAEVTYNQLANHLPAAGSALEYDATSVTVEEQTLRVGYSGGARLA